MNVGVKSVIQTPIEPPLALFPAAASPRHMLVLVLLLRGPSTLSSTAVASTYIPSSSCAHSVRSLRHLPWQRTLTSSRTHVAPSHKHLLGTCFFRSETLDSKWTAKDSNATGCSCFRRRGEHSKGAPWAETMLMKIKYDPFLREPPSIDTLDLFVCLLEALLRLSWIYLEITHRAQAHLH